MYSYSVTKLWNGQTINDHSNYIKVDFTGLNDVDEMEINIKAPFFNDSPPEGGKYGEPFYQLWDYEVVELFFLDSNTNKYLELEFGPHGNHLVLFLDGKRNIIKHSLPLNYSSQIDGKEWIGKAKIPKSYFPQSVDKFNIYGIHGNGTKRSYEALFPVPGTQPDFHRLQYFGDIQLL